MSLKVLRKQLISIVKNPALIISPLNLFYNFLDLLILETLDFNTRIVLSVEFYHNCVRFMLTFMCFYFFFLLKNEFEKLLNLLVVISENVYFKCCLNYSFLTL